MTVYYDKKRHHWRYSFIVRRTRYSGYCDDLETGAPASGKLIAKNIETKIRAAILRDEPVYPILASKITMAQAIAAYAAQVQNSPSWQNQRIYARELLAYFGEETPIVEISESSVWNYIKWAASKKLKYGQAVILSLAIPCH